MGRLFEDVTVGQSNALDGVTVQPEPPFRPGDLIRRINNQGVCGALGMPEGEICTVLRCYHRPVSTSWGVEVRRATRPTIDDNFDADRFELYQRRPQHGTTV